MTAHSANAADPKVLFTFDEATRGDWTSVDDTVMGGRSDGGAALHDGVLHFSGTLSLESNGGFSSIRHSVELDLSGYNGIRLRVKGDGRSYQLRLHTDARYSGQPVAFGATFQTNAGEWTEVDVPFDTLRATFRGRLMSDYFFDPAAIEQVGILLADKQAGPFELQVDRLVAYGSHRKEPRS
ncbi:CIA30 family protein [Elongatibacter sediminis]|uniref:CIA30 family protein n=1 Tax=Elongatibacter sediminis TaxID=3119006 RepID=A0AAW9RGG8_9GAMM